MVARRGEDCRHKRFFHLRHLRGIVLQERLVPDGPHAIKVVVATKALVCIIVFPTVVVLESGATGKGLETHRAALGTMEESCLVALPGQQRGNAVDMVHGGGCQEERLYKHGDAAQNGRHAVYRLATIAVAVAEGDALGY